MNFISQHPTNPKKRHSIEYFLIDFSASNSSHRWARIHIKKPDILLAKASNETLSNTSFLNTPLRTHHSTKKSHQTDHRKSPSLKPMLQLLQWDVGSGKTIVAAIAAYYVIKHLGGQVAFIAPLEILAQQHLRSIAKVLLPLGIKMGILTWSISKAEKDKTKQQLASGQLDIVIGTHAILQENVTFKDLQLAVIDDTEFGVMQRAFFKKFNSPHIIQMSATPIPRSMALAFFGEFEVSVIDQMPMGRIPMTTKIIPNSERKKIKPRIMTKINQGQKVFIVTPLIEESDKLGHVGSCYRRVRRNQRIVCWNQRKHT